MKKLLLISGLVIAATPAYAAHDYSTMPMYLSAQAGYTHTRDSDFDAGAASGKFEFDGTANFSGAVGAYITPHIRTEVEVSYRKADLDKIDVDGAGSFGANGHAKTWGFLANGYYDFMPDKQWNPYISAGLGAAHHRAELSGGGVSTSDSDTVFAYQVGAGLNYKLTQQVALTGGYRYFGTSDPSFGAVDTEYRAHEFRGGVMYKF